MAALALLIVALARPQKPIGSTPLSIEGIDIMLSLDISGSMLAQDFLPNRLSVALEEAQKFIDKRPNDRIGLVIFSGESFTQCPLTSDHGVLKNLLENIQIEMLNSGTAIGMGLVTAVNRLRTSEAKTKVVILLTDGVNNSGYIDPITAKEMAIAEGVRVYVIGVGTEGKAPMPARDPFTGQIVLTEQEVQIDEPLMKQIAEGTGGQYYRARNQEELQSIYAAIDQLERTKMKVSAYTHKEELFMPFLLAGLILLILERGMRTVYLKQSF
jgi:Ca-activated chloride channel family protein